MELHPENADTLYEVLLGLLGRDVFNAEGSQNVVPIALGDVETTTQQAILDAAYAHVRASHPQAKLSVALGDVIGDYATATAMPFGANLTFVYVQRSNGAWRAMESKPGADVGERARHRGFPDALMATFEAHIRGRRAASAPTSRTSLTQHALRSTIATLCMYIYERKAFGCRPLTRGLATD
jgi:hypothetical protein